MITDAIRKATEQYGLPRMMPELYPWLIRRPVRECVTWAVDMNTNVGDYADSRNHILNFPEIFICSYVLTCTPVWGFGQ